MSLSRVLGSALAVGAAMFLAAWDTNSSALAQAGRTTTANFITGEGLPNPNPVVPSSRWQ